MMLQTSYKICRVCAVRELSGNDITGLTTGLVWLSDLLGTPALVPEIMVYPLDVEDDNASAYSPDMADGRGTLLFQSLVLGEEPDEDIVEELGGVALITLDLTGSFTYNGGGIHTGWTYFRINPLSQNGMTGDMPGTITHEMLHAMGLTASTVTLEDDGDEADDDSYYVVNDPTFIEDAFSSAINPYTAGLRDAFGTKAESGMPIEVISADEVDSVERDADTFHVVYNEDKTAFGGVYFTGENVREVIGEDTVIYRSDYDPIDDDGNLVEATITNSVTGGIPINAIEYDTTGYMLELSHLELQNSLMSHQIYRNWQTYMEAELALLQDIGYEFDRKRYFGTSVYGSGGDVVITQAFGERENYEWTGNPSTQATAIGVHVYGSLNTVSVEADQRADGDESFGVRVDGASNDITIAPGTLISANGTNGTGVAFTYGSGHTLTIEAGATVEATGDGGRALLFDFGSNELGDYVEYRGSWIRAQQTGYEDGNGDTEYAQFIDDPLTTLQGSLVDQVTIYGTVDAEEGDAIYISCNAHVGRIVIYDTASITGDIVSNWNALGTKYSYEDEDDETVYFVQLDVNYEGFEDLFKAQVVYEDEDSIPDLTTNIVFKSSTEDSLFSYSGNISSSSGIRLTVESGATELSGTIDVLGVNIKEEGVLLGSAAYNLTAVDESGPQVVSTDDEEFVQGALVNSGTLISTSLTGEPTINGDYAQTETGVLVLDVSKDGEVTPLSVSGKSIFESGSSVSLIPEMTYYESGSTIDSTTLTASDVVTGTIHQDDGLTIVFDVEALSGMSNTLTFTESDGVLTISRASDAYSSLVSGGWQHQIAQIFDNSAGAAASSDAQSIFAAMDFSSDSSIVQSVAEAFGGDSHLQTVKSDFAFERTISRVVDNGFETLPEGRDIWVMPFGGRSKESHGGSGWRSRSTGIAAGVEFHEGKADYGFHMAAAHLKKIDDWNGEARSSGLWLGASWDRRYSENEDWLAQFRGRIGFVHAKNERNVNILSRTSKLDTSGMQYHLTASTRTGPVFTYAETGRLMPYVGVEGSLIYKPSRSESGYGALDIDDSMYRSLRVQAGVKTTSPRFVSAANPAYAWSFGGEAAYERELLNKAGDFKASIVGMSGSFERPVEWEGRDRGIIRGSVSLTKDNSFTAKIGLDGEFSKAGNSVYGFVEARWKF